MVKKLALAILGLIALGAVGTGLMYWRLSSTYEARLSKKLINATKSLPHILGQEYFDKIKDKSSVSDEEYKQVFDKLESYVKDIGEIIYIYAYTLDEEGRVVEVADTPSVVERLDQSPFFMEFKSAPRLLLEMLKNPNAPRSALPRGSDEYGEYFSYFEIYENKHGRRFLIGADIETKTEKEQLRRILIISFSTSSLGILVYVFTLTRLKTGYKKHLSSGIILLATFGILLHLTRQENLQKLEDTLLISARSVPEILGEDYLTKANKPGAVSQSEYVNLIRRINAFNKDMGITYSFALRRSGEQIVFIADSTTGNELEQGFYAGYWGNYDTSPEKILPLFESPGKMTISYKDDFGSFISVFISRYNRNREIVVFGADQKQEKVWLEEAKNFSIALIIVLIYGTLLKLWEHYLSPALIAEEREKREVPQELFWKTALITSSAIVTFLAIFYIYAQRLLYASFTDLETKELQNELDRFKLAMEQEKSYVIREVFDWAAWDDAYQFAQDQNEKFSKDYITTESLFGAQIDVFIYIDLNGKFLGGIAYDDDQRREDPQLVNRFVSFLDKHPGLFQFKTTSGKRVNSGLVNIEGENFLIATTPIIRSDFTGEPRGFLVLAQKINRSFVSNLGSRQNLNLQIYKLEEARELDRFKPVIAEILATGNDVILPRTDNFTYGYSILNDIDNKPVALVRIVRRRDTFLTGKAIVDTTLLSALIGFGVVILLTNLVILQKSILARLLKLVKDLHGQADKYTERFEPLSVSGRDEISYLIQTFNQLLEANHRNNEKFSKIFRASPTAIVIARISDSKILEVNWGFEQLFDIPAEDIKYRSIEDFGGWLFGVDEDKVFGNDKSNDYLRNIEVRIKDRIGKEIICNLSAEIIKINDEPCMLYNISDITQLKKLNDSINRANSMLKAQQETSIEGILATDEQGRIVSFNQRFCQMWHLNHALLEGKLIHQLLNDKSVSFNLKEAIEIAFDLEGGSYSDEIPLEDGRVFDVRAQQICSDNRKYYGQIWYFRDITSTVIAEEKLLEQYQQLCMAKDEIDKLNEKLKEENIRMSTELNVARHLQEMILPKKEDLWGIPGIDIAAFMEPADEVGGDYYDVFCHDRNAYIAIGDITGHGLDSGIIMLMVQTAITTLVETGFAPQEVLTTLNKVLIKNLDRMKSDKNLTLSMLSWQEGVLKIVGQHEELIILRNDNTIEMVDTFDLGFPIGLEKDISPFLNYWQTEFLPGEAAILFTDGVTEAEGEDKKLYTIDRLCEVALRYRRLHSQALCDKIVSDIRHHIGDRKVLDDITLIVVKQKCDYG